MFALCHSCLCIYAYMPTRAHRCVKAHIVAMKTLPLFSDQSWRSLIVSEYDILFSIQVSKKSPCLHVSEKEKSNGIAVNLYFIIHNFFLMSRVFCLFCFVLFCFLELMESMAFCIYKSPT